MYSRVLQIFLFVGLVLVSKITLGQYQTNGSAVSTSCNCWRVTPDATGQSGSVWNVNLFDLSNPFSFNFDVFLGCDNGGADGLAFVLQPLSVNAGSSGGGIGYAGIAPSLAIELDNYQNGGEPNFDHMAIQQNGVTAHNGPNNLAGPVPISATSNNIEDCAWHTFQVNWNPATQTMTVFFDGALRLTYTGDIINNIFGGNPNVYWGFTAATGAADNEHQFCNALEPEFQIVSQSQCAGVPTDFESSSTVATGFVSDYQWDFGDGNTASGVQVSNTYTTAGNYTVTLTISSEGCTESETTQITINPAPNVDLGPDLSICDGASTQLTANGLAGGEQLQWNPAQGLDNPVISNPNASPTNTTTYTLGVIDINGCVNTDDIEITVNPLPVANAGADQTICEGDAAQLSASGGVQYGWNPATDLSNPSISDPEASPVSTTSYSVTVVDGNGCENTDDVTVSVDPLPTVNAGADQAVCDEQSVQLGASGAQDYSWSPTAGLDNAAVSNPIFSGSLTTLFTVTGTDTNGCSNTDDVEVVVNPLPVADFDPPDDVCLGFPTVVVDNSIGNGLNYFWDFGDGNTSTDPLPTNTYANLDTYTITLVVTDVNGCQDSDSEIASVSPLPEPQMNIFDGAEFCEFEEIQFENQTPGTYATVLWDFGDNGFIPGIPNTQSTEENPTFSYNSFAFGPYTVSLVITDNNGCLAVAQSLIAINEKPEAVFSSSIECEDAATSFTDESTSLSSDINTWSWDFGDTVGTSPMQSPVYQYQQAGTYTAALIIETDAGCADTVSNLVYVNPVPIVKLTGIDTCLNDETSFTNISTPQDSTIVDWLWDFGDGITDTGITSAHTYQDFGDFTVNLTATSDSGCVGNSATQVTVHPNPEPAFSMITAEGCAPHEVVFIDESTIADGFISEFFWDLGDSTISAEQNPINVYPDSGYFDISLLVTSTEGCNTDTTVVNAVRSNITPVAAFEILNNRVSVLEADLDMTESSQHALTYFWSFGDGAISNEVLPEHEYREPGIYDVVLTVENGDCSDSDFGRIIVDPIFTFYIPSAFSPDGDGINETFYGQGESIQQYNMKISNRWGEQLFESNNPDFHWDGSFKGKQVQQGTYIYEFFILDESLRDHTYSGHFQLLR